MRYLLAIIAAAASAAVAADRPIIHTDTDLQTRFEFSAPPSEVMMRDDLVAMLPRLRTEGERLLRDYQIDDNTVTQQLRIGLANIAILQGRKSDALKLVADYRAGETKPQTKILGGIWTDVAATMLNVPADRRCAVGAAHVTDLVAGADPMVIRDQFVGSYSGIQTASTAFLEATAVGTLDPIAKERGSLNVLQAMNLVRWRVNASSLPSCRDALSAAARRWIDAPANRAVDIWPARQPTPSALAGAKPVVVAVWDRGFDATLFPGQLARDPAEPLDGRDNDGDGVVDDWNGPTYEVDLRPTSASMQLPTQFLQRRLAIQMALDKGELDLRYGLNTPEAAMFAEFARTAPTDEQADEYLAQMENSSRSHGTACASEIADGAPYVRLYNVAALPWGRGEDKRDIPYDEATIGRWATAIDRIGVRMRGAGVRVVSMSWGLTADEITQQLLDHGLEKNAARAKTRGLAMRQTIADALHRLMTSSPNILFVVAAGNSDQADDVQGDAVKGFSLPNLIIVGATGTNGRPTAFTVFGKTVAIYSQGEAVPLRWPGNIPVRESGTSMAAPLVARAAAQMLAVRPSLSAATVRDGLLSSATTGEGGLKLVHPAAAVTWARGHR